MSLPTVDLCAAAANRGEKPIGCSLHAHGVEPRLTKQGSKLVRWAAIEAVQKLPADTKLRVDRDRIAARRGRNIATTAAARKLLTLVFYGLRDGHIPCLERKAAA